MISPLWERLRETVVPKVTELNFRVSKKLCEFYSQSSSRVPFRPFAHCFVIKNVVLKKSSISKILVFSWFFGEHVSDNLENRLVFRLPKQVNVTQNPASSNQNGAKKINKKWTTEKNLLFQHYILYEKVVFKSTNSHSDWAARIKFAKFFTHLCKFAEYFTC